MVDKPYNINEALALLRGSLAGLGLERVNISVTGHGLTREKSAGIARDLVAGGFGREVKPADRSVRYETRDGWFSWDTVEEGDDLINLFYSLGEDDQPVKYLIMEAEVNQAQNQGSSMAGEQGKPSESGQAASGAGRLPAYMPESGKKNRWEYGQVGMSEESRWESLPEGVRESRRRRPAENGGQSKPEFSRAAPGANCDCDNRLNGQLTKPASTTRPASGMDNDQGRFLDSRSQVRRRLF